MFFANVSYYAHSVATALHFILFASPQTTRPTAVGLWLARIIFFSLILRTYLVPWLLALMSSHVRIRSISFRSIRGLYFRQGNRTWRVERIRYGLTTQQGSRRFALKIDGFNLHIDKSEAPAPKKTRTKRSHSLSLEHLKPSPIAHKLWGMVSAVFRWFEPYVRPLARSYVISCLRFGIQWLPKIMQAVTFDLQSAVVTFAEVPDAQLLVEGVNLHTALILTQVEGPTPGTQHPTAPNRPDDRSVYGVAALKTRLADSFRRSLDKAWGEARGHATLSLKVSNVVGSMTRQGPGNPGSVPFLLSPGTVDLSISAKFNPREGTIERHSLRFSLRLGDCSAKIDLLRTLLNQVLPKAKPKPKASDVDISAVYSPPASAFASPPPASSFSLRSQASAALPSPARSFASALFSPRSLFSPSSLKSPIPGFFSPGSGRFLSPRSPASPFFKAISASMRPSKRSLVPPAIKLKDHKDLSSLSILHSVHITVGSINVSISANAFLGPYKSVASDISLHLGVSGPSHSLHREFVGRTPSDPVADRDAYALTVTLGQMSLERETVHHITQVAKMGPLSCDVLAHQWPRPFLHPSPLLQHDPNAPFIAVAVKLGGVQMTERLKDLQRLVKCINALPKPAPKVVTAPPPVSRYMDLPRVSATFETGPVGARIIYDSDNGSSHRAVELRTNGLFLRVGSEFRHPTPVITRAFPAASSVQPLHWTATLTSNLEPVLIRIRSQHDIPPTNSTKSVSAEDGFLEDPPVLSLGASEAIISLNAVAQIDTRGDTIGSIDKTAIACNASFVAESLCVELWHPTSVDAVLQLLTIAPPKPTRSPTSPPPKPKPLPILPIGLHVRVAVGRFVVFITAPDISPDDDLELSRGFATRATIALNFSSIRSGHEQWFDDLKLTKSRAKLGLQPAPSVDAIKLAKATPLEENPALVRLHLRNFVVRSAVATPFEADEPIIAGRDDLADNAQEIIRIDHTSVDVTLHSKRNPATQTPIPHIKVSVDIPSVLVDFHIAHIYSILLGIQTIQLLFPDKAPTSQEVKPEKAVRLSIQANVASMRILCKLPTQKVVACFDNLGAHIEDGQHPRVLLGKASAFAALPPRVNRWEEPKHNQWGEFLTLTVWEIAFDTAQKPASITIDGNSGRFRIPHGFVLADLVHDISVVVKAIKHLAYMASAGCYSPMPYPEAEGPKSVPQISVRLALLDFEAQDDPFESKLGAIWRAGTDAVKQRMDREEAFQAKVAAIRAAEAGDALLTSETKSQTDQNYQFSAKHTVSIQDARRRLDEVHVLDWSLRLEKLKHERTQEEISVLQTLTNDNQTQSFTLATLPDFVITPTMTTDPPLLRAKFDDLCLTISPPSFPLSRLPDVMFDYGNGLPRDTKFTLLVPLHIHFTLSAVTATLRDYPIPLLSIPLPDRGTTVSWTFETDLIIGEEMGTDASVDWCKCPIIEPSQARHGETPFSILIPKTIMPVKTYARPNIHIKSPDATVISWGVSYTAAMQDVMRVVDSLTTPPRDTSPHLGFWDKMRLVFHWTLRVTFENDIRFYMKGTRDPHNVHDSGTGFVLCWKGHPEIRVGYENYQKELIQVLSEEMIIAIPNLRQFSAPQSRLTARQKPFDKVCARLSSGVRFGVGFVLERSCALDCAHCTGDPFHRKCRYFSSLPHWAVVLEKKPKVPTLGSQEDSYNGFRSDFVHLSLSLACSTQNRNATSKSRPSNLYLTPKMFAHFWAWCSLFEGAASLPIRQGKYYPPRPISPKLGRHLATIKYRISLLNLYVMHGYVDDSRQAWADGVTPWVGVKGKVDEIQADMHQREEEATVAGPLPNTTRVTRRKPFCAAEVMIKGLELRTLLATFDEPLKKDVDIAAPPQRSNYRKHANLPTTSKKSAWYDLDDFVELDWSPNDSLVLNLLPLATCPHFTYYKKNEALAKTAPQASKFGSEHTHMCLLGKEASVSKTQLALAVKRLNELKLARDSNSSKEPPKALNKAITLVEEYIKALKEVEANPNATNITGINYHLPADMLSTDESAEFNNVYQIHCPSIFLDSAVRDIMMQYYYCSRDRRGYEYHMSTRAIQFILDQANAVLAQRKEEAINERASAGTPQLTTALWKMLKNETNSKISLDLTSRTKEGAPLAVEPLDGWATGVSLSKSHYCLLLKPQIVLRGETAADTMVLAATKTKLQSFAIMDIANANDPITGKVMSRSYSSVSGMQCFAPVERTTLVSRDGSVPLEILIDLRCESQAFERLAPQTEATFQYDKFNRLRLRNNVTSVATKPSNSGNSGSLSDSHLQDQTDLLRIHIPRFTVSANTEHFQAISNILTKLLLFSDPGHKIRLDRLETMVFTYDFADLRSAADVVSNLQGRLRDALETERITMRNPRRLEDDQGKLSLLHLKAHIFLLVEELNLLFDAIKLAQDRFDDHTDQKSALLLHASSSEISWRMLDARRNLLSKLVVSNINFHWLSRQDSSTVNHLTIGNLTAFDGSRHAIWTEILSKYDEPANHPMLKKGLFLLAKWIILPPVGGIAIYECFELSLHPIRLQLDAKVGHKIMEYVWPNSEERETSSEGPKSGKAESTLDLTFMSPTSGRSSIDSPRALHSPPRPLSPDGKSLALAPPLRKLGASRSFTDLRSSSKEPVSSLAGFLSPPAFFNRTPNPEMANISSVLDQESIKAEHDPEVTYPVPQDDDAQIMRSRSTQKTFVLVRVASINLLLSVVKEGSFECTDARIKTRELEYRNQTWSFEDLVGQFIPSNMSWRGWVKMAFHQPLLPVLPVARELLSKTKWGSKSTIQPHDSPFRLLHPRAMLATDDDSRLNSTLVPVIPQIKPSSSKKSGKAANTPILTSGPLTSEPESMDADLGVNQEEAPSSSHRQRVRSLFGSKRSKSKGPLKRQSEDTLR